MGDSRLATLSDHMTIPHSPPFEETMQRVRAEYGETPNLRLTPSRAQFMFALDPAACAAILNALLKENFLSRTGDGLFVRSPITG